MQNSSVRYTKAFDEKYGYEGKDLGASVVGCSTVFKLWSPLADRVELRLYPDGLCTENTVYELTKEEQGVWSFSISENLHETYYDYRITFGTEITITADPYATACGCNGMRSMVVDLSKTNPEGFKEDHAPEKQAEDIIYELHIKDFSHDPESEIPEEWRGRYKAFTYQKADGSLPVCMQHLKDLGITHVHLLPFCDYGYLDESGDEKQFNWGYDPFNYNVPEGSYATDPYNGTVRIRECKEMIQALHKQGIRVIMDVVYNHTYVADSWLGRSVPGYYYRTQEDGTYSDGSACGNDIACGRRMADNYIADSVMYWAKEYHLDGFRFDLMGLMTVELMNRIREELDAQFGPGEKLLYGEPWRAAPSPMEDNTHAALKDNIHLLDPQIAVFSDNTRDVIKGHVFYVEEPGFVNGGTGFEKDVLHAVSGWIDCVEGFKPRGCSQIVNYVSAHDNFTLWDKLLISMCGMPKTPESFYEDNEEILRANKLAAMMYFCFQGRIFFQAGEEFGRTKAGDENSYRSDPEINMLNWKQKEKRNDLVAYYQGLIRLRKRMPGLCDKSQDAYTRITEKTVESEKIVSFQIENHAETACEWDTVMAVFNASDDTFEKKLPSGCWEILADADETDCRRETADSVKVQPHSGMILGRKG